MGGCAGAPGRPRGAGRRKGSEAGLGRFGCPLQALGVGAGSSVPCQSLVSRAGDSGPNRGLAEDVAAGAGVGHRGLPEELLALLGDQWVLHGVVPGGPRGPRGQSIRSPQKRQRCRGQGPGHDEHGDPASPSLLAPTRRSHQLYVVGTPNPRASRHRPAPAPRRGRTASHLDNWAASAGPPGTPLSALPVSSP